MGVISVRLDNDTEARLKREAQAHGRALSAFLREQLTGAGATVENERPRKDEEDTDAILRQICDFLYQLRQEQEESDYFTKILIANTLRALTRSKEEAKKVWEASSKMTMEHFAKGHEEQSP